MIADIEELDEMDGSEIYARRLNAKEVLTQMRGDNFLFPVADGTGKTPGGDRRLKASTLIRDHLLRGEEQEVFRGESEGLSSPNPLQDDSIRDDAEAKKDFWSITGRFHLSPSLGTQSQTVRAETRIISYSTEVHRRCQNHSYVTGCIVGKHIDDYWNEMHGQASHDSFY